eukprot:jgi/Ulvmu1/6262/UM028_0120.1
MSWARACTRSGVLVYTDEVTLSCGSHLAETPGQVVQGSTGIPGWAVCALRARSHVLRGFAVCWGVIQTGANRPSSGVSMGTARTAQRPRGGPLRCHTAEGQPEVGHTC